MNWLRGFSIRTRLTIGTLVVAFIVSLAAGLLLNANVQSIVRSTTVQLLRDDAAPIEAAIRADPISPKPAAGEGQLVLVISPGSRVALVKLPDALVQIAGKLEHIGTTPTVVNNDRKQYLVLRENVDTPQGQWRIIVARNLEPGDLVTAQLRMTYIIGGAILFILVGLTSWVLSGAALRPVGRMRAEAQRLGDATTAGLLPVGPARDDLAELATTLNNLIDRNRASVERERQMISDASHELRTPLAVLNAQLDAALLATRKTEEGRARVEQARDTALRLSKLATNLLELSSLESRSGRATSSGAVLAVEFAECVDRARTLADDRGVVVDFDVHDPEPTVTYPIAASDFARLTDNLLANAVAASPPSASVRAELANDQGVLVISIADQGTGMPEEFIPMAFDRFTRSEDARARRSGGSGLGLAIVAAIVSSAGGDVRLTNRTPGLLVRVSIPSQRGTPNR